MTSTSETTGTINNNDKGNLGSIRNGATATFTLTNASEQAMVLTFKTGNNNSSNPKVTVTMNDGESDFFSKTLNIENTGGWDPKTKHVLYISSVPAGTISLTFSFANSGSYVCNLGSIGLYAISSLDQIPSSTALTLTDGDHNGVSVDGSGVVGYIENGDYSVYTVNNTEDAYLTMKMDVLKYNEGQVQVTVTDVATSVSTTPQVFEVPVSGEDKEFELSAPITAGVKNIRLDYIKDGSGYIMNYSNLRFVKRADYDPSAVLTISNLTIDGEAAASAVLSGVNDNEDSYTLTGNIYTAMPTINAMFNNGDPVTVTPSLSGSDATYTLTGEDFASTLIIEGVHVYAPTGSEKTADIKYNNGTISDKTWTNGTYTMVSNKGYDDASPSFKTQSNSYTISVPSDIVVKQLILKDLCTNYSGKGAYVSGASSTGATAYCPTKNRFYHSSEGNPFDYIININGHSAGNDVAFTLSATNPNDLGQAKFWVQLVTLNSNPGTAPSSTAQTATISDNDAVVAVTFDREIANDVTATIGGNSVKAKGGAAVLYFPVWNLNYSTNYTLTIAAGAATDNYGNSTSSAIEVAVNIPAKSAVAMSTYDYVVSNVSEFTAAISAVNSSNTSSSSTRKTIFIKNGNYDLGTEVGTGKSLVQLKCYNVSLIGESRDGVILYGETDGISNPVLNLRDKTGFYLQDLTVKNTHDYGTGLFDGGVAVAVYGGDKTIMKNVRMLSNQDTQVTGHRAYFEDCAIHGTVDFICGGGDNFYYRTDLVLENRGGNCITAPSTNSSQHWGYVFDHCTIKAVDATAATTNDGSYSLGRPWQNEPRAYYLNTDMQVLCATAGWAGMSTLTTHFYEYNSLHNGSAVDLSGRENSPTSVNTYTPVLSSSEAAQFTVHNVLGGTDAWDPAADVAQVAAPQNISASARTLKWNAVADAKLYVVLLNGEYVTNTTSTTYDVDEDGVYTVKAANKFGGLGAASAAVTISTGTYVRAFANRYLNTLCFPYQIDSYTGATFYTLQYKEMDGEDVTNVVLEEHVGALEAATPYFYLPDDGEDELVCEYSGDEVATPSTVNGVVGIYAKQTVPTNDYVTYQGQIRKVGTGVSLHEYRAYIHMDDVSSTPVAPKTGRRRLLIRNADAPQTPTDVETIFESSNPQIFKYIKEGQLLILRDGRTYNAQGRLVQ